MTSPGDGPDDIQSIISVERLNRFMSSPNWTDAQTEAVRETIEDLESTLGSRLNSPITPIPYAETVTILRSGQVNTSYPVASIDSINGVAIVDGALPGGWRLQNPRLYATEPPSFGGTPFTLDTWSLGGGYGEVGRVDGIGSVKIEYQAGWGNVPALRLALLKKASAIITNQHDDTVVVRDLDANQPPPVPKEEWTDAEMKELELFRNLVAWR